MADPSQFAGECVSIRGLSNGRLLFTSLKDYYLAGPLVGGDPAANPRDRHRLGLENPKLLQSFPKGGLRHVVAVGRVQDCETVRNMVDESAGPDTIVMVLGFCHYASGPYLALRQFDVGKPLHAARFTGEALRLEVGDLIFAPNDWHYRRYVEGLSHQYLAALRSGDKATFKALHLEGERPEWQSSATRLAFGSHPGFRALRRSSGTPQTAIFLTSDGTTGAEAAALRGDAPGDYSATICFCTNGDCTKRWPISTVDADNGEDRPYVCTGVGPYVVPRRGTFPAFSTERGRFGLPEPTQVN